MIPKIIHQTWKTTIIPEHLRPYQETWSALHPEWECRLWTDEDNCQLVRQSYPRLLDFYQALPYPILKVEFIKLLYLDHFGGLYVDLDFEALRPLDEILTGDRIVLGRETGGLGGFTRGRDYVMNALMASPAGHPFWMAVLENAVAGFRGKRPWELYEIYVIGRVIEFIDRQAIEYQQVHSDMMIHSHEFFYPSPQSERNAAARRALGVQQQSYAVHHYDDSWFSPWLKSATRLRYAASRLWRTAPFRATGR